MGNSSSKPPSASYISKPVPLKGDKSSGAVHRRATAHASNNTSSQVPSTHRRTRSSIAQGNHVSQAPPPSYQEALNVPVNSPVDNNLLNIPMAPQTLLRSRSEDPNQSRNPFLRRPVSYNGDAQSSEPTPNSLVSPGISWSFSAPAASAATPSVAPSDPTPNNLVSPGISWSFSAPAALAATPSVAPRWTTEEERLAYLRKPLRQESYEDALEILKKYDIAIIVDDSGSMTNENRWSEAKTALATLAETAATYDADGIDVFFLNSTKQGKGMKVTFEQNAAQVQRLFDSVSPSGPTPIGDTLDRILRNYINQLDREKAAGREASVKPINYIILTDGAATDDPAEVIANAARRLDQGGYLLSQLGIQFVQIGTDINATHFLKQLDDDLSGFKGVRDIVDTTPYLGGALNAETLIKILLGGINRRVDRKGGRSVMSR